MTYNVTVELDTPAEDLEALADRLYDTDTAKRLHMAVHGAPGDRLAVTVTVEANGPAEAVYAGCWAVSSLGLTPYAVSSLPTDEFDRRADGDDPWLSVPQAATALGISQQRVRQLLDEGKLTGKKVGRDWNVSARSVQDRCTNQV